MKHALYLILAFSLLSCQNQDNNSNSPEQAAADTTAQQAPKSEPVDSAYLILPGESIGKVKVGMQAQALTATLGKPDSTDAAMGKALLFWINQEANQRHYLTVYTESDFGSDHPTPMVKQIQVNSPQFRTPENINTGKSLSEIREKYKQLEPLAHYTNEAKQQVYIFDAKPAGIAFEVTLPDSTCTAITVYDKGKDIAGTYLPLHPDMTMLRQP